MGNRAVVAFSTASSAPVIYLHWNGGRASVEAFLAAARHLGLRHAGRDHAATLDRLAELIAVHYFGGRVGFTVYRETFLRADTANYDNGTYLLGHDLLIIDRLFTRSGEEVNAEKTSDIFQRITASAPHFNFDTRI